MALEGSAGIGCHRPSPQDQNEPWGDAGDFLRRIGSTRQIKFVRWESKGWKGCLQVYGSHGGSGDGGHGTRGILGQLFGTVVI